MSLVGFISSLVRFGWFGFEEQIASLADSRAAPVRRRPACFTNEPVHQREVHIRNSKIEDENGKRKSRTKSDRTKSERLKQRAKDAYSVNSGDKAETRALRLDA
jgi:hypothetical protein